MCVHGGVGVHVNVFRYICIHLHFHKCIWQMVVLAPYAVDNLSVKLFKDTTLIKDTVCFQQVIRN